MTMSNYDNIPTVTEQEILDQLEIVERQGHFPGVSAARMRAVAQAEAEAIALYGGWSIMKMLDETMIARQEFTARRMVELGY